MRSLPDDLTLSQKYRAEKPAPGSASVFPHFRLGICQVHIELHGIDTGPRPTPLQQLLDAAAAARRSPDMLKSWSSCDSWRKREFDKMPQFTAAAVKPAVPRCAPSCRTVAETIEPSCPPGTIRYRRIDGLMTSSDLYTVGLPDAPSQSSLPVTRGMRSPSELTCGLLALFARMQPRARRLLRNNKPARH